MSKALWSKVTALVAGNVKPTEYVYFAADVDAAKADDVAKTQKLLTVLNAHMKAMQQDDPIVVNTGNLLMIVDSICAADLESVRQIRDQNATIARVTLVLEDMRGALRTGDRAYFAQIERWIATLDSGDLPAPGSLMAKIEAMPTAQVFGGEYVLKARVLAAIGAKP